MQWKQKHWNTENGSDSGHLDESVSGGIGGGHSVSLYIGMCNREICKNYRGISLLSISDKMYGRIIIDRLKETTRCRIGEEQAKFIENSWFADQIVLLNCWQRSISRRRRNYIPPSWTWRRNMIELMEEHCRRFSESLMWEEYCWKWKVVQDNFRVVVKINGEQSTSFNKDVGVRQRCMISLMLFNIPYIWMGW